MSAGLRVGWYVHHHGHGHLHRALAVASVLAADGAAVTVLGSRPAEPHPAVADWLTLPRDDDGDPRAVTANGTLHWAPRHHDGLRARMHAISAWIATARPDVVVCDVSQEVALLCRLHGVPVVSVLQPGERSDAPHLTGLGAADVLVACWPAAAGMLVDGLPAGIAARVVAVGIVPMLVVMRMPEALLAMERHEHEAEAVERRDEHTEEHAPVRVGRARDVGGMDRFDQRILREEARSAGEADQRQRSDQ